MSQPLYLPHKCYIVNLHSMSTAVWISRMRYTFIIVFVIKKDKQHHRNMVFYCSLSVMLSDSSNVSIKCITLENKHLQQRKTVATTKSQSNFSDLVFIGKGCLRIRANQPISQDKVTREMAVPDHFLFMAVIPYIHRNCAQ